MFSTRNLRVFTDSCHDQPPLISRDSFSGFAVTSLDASCLLRVVHVLRGDFLEAIAELCHHNFSIQPVCSYRRLEVCISQPKAWERVKGRFSCHAKSMRHHLDVILSPVSALDLSRRSAWTMSPLSHPTWIETWEHSPPQTPPPHQLRAMSPL